VSDTADVGIGERVRVVPATARMPTRREREGDDGSDFETTALR
jgi:hypothetical protein